jgi:hypothetical protein
MKLAWTVIAGSFLLIPVFADKICVRLMCKRCQSAFFSRAGRPMQANAVTSTFNLIFFARNSTPYTHLHRVCEPSKKTNCDGLSHGPNMDLAFTENITLPLDIDEKVFEGITLHEPFNSWQDGTRPWRLEVSGGPGSGKVCLSREHHRCVILYTYPRSRLHSLH